MGDGGKWLSYILVSNLRFTQFHINLPCGAVVAASDFLFFEAPNAIRPAEGTSKEVSLPINIPGFIIVTAGVICSILRNSDRIRCVVHYLFGHPMVARGDNSAPTLIFK